MQRKFGVILGYINLFLHNIISFLLTPLMLTTWGKGDFGVDKLVSITAYFMLPDLVCANKNV